MEKISFSKMSGAGNDFIILDLDKNIPFVLSNEFISKLCDRRDGIGADGVITLCGSNKYSFEMEYFNSDGSTATLCGNGARCAVRYAQMTGRLDQKGSFTSGGTEYSGEILDNGMVRFNLNPPAEIRYNFAVKYRGQLIKAHFVNTGSPHLVINIKDMSRNPGDISPAYDNIGAVPVKDAGKEIRFLPEFAPGGVNVNFIHIKDDKLFIRTYERGVENETLACGTGSAAAAIVAYSQYKFNKPVVLHTRGGEKLTVDFEYGNGKITDLSLTGPAREIFQGSFTLKDFL
jgi:diaminopimelate epimerase